MSGNSSMPAGPATSGRGTPVAPACRRSLRAHDLRCRLSTLLAGCECCAASALSLDCTGLEKTLQDASATARRACVRSVCKDTERSARDVATCSSGIFLRLVVVVNQTQGCGGVGFLASLPSFRRLRRPSFRPSLPGRPGRVRPAAACPYKKKQVQKLTSSARFLAHSSA